MPKFLTPENHLTKCNYGWILLWMSIVLSALLCRPPIPVDETRYLSVAWEMWQIGQFLVPHINGIPYSHKPPMLFWLMGAGWKIFGVNSWSARLTAPIFGLLTILLTVRLARLLWPGRDNLYRLIPYVFIGTLFWSFYATLTMFDIPMSFFSLVAWAGLWSQGRGKRYSGWFFYGIAIALGILTKGPVILIYTVPAALLAPWWLNRKQVFSWTWWYSFFFLATVTGILAALAWAIPAAKAGGEVYGQTLLFGQTAGRLIHSFAHQRPFYWYVVLLPFLFFPWLFHPAILTTTGRKSLTPQDRFCLSILIPGFVLLSAVSGKQVHYLLPLFPAAVLLIARRLTSTQSIPPFPRRLLPIFLLVLSLSLTIVPFFPLQGGDGDMLRLLPHWLGVIPLLAAFFLHSRQQSPTGIFDTAAILVGMLIMFHLALARPLHKIYQEEAIGEKIHMAQTTGKQVAVYPARMADQFQFAGRLTDTLFPQQTMEDIVRWSQTHKGQCVLLFLDKNEYPFFSHDGTVPPFVNRWMIFRSTDGIPADYNLWKSTVKFSTLQQS